MSDQSSDTEFLPSDIERLSLDQLIRYASGQLLSPESAPYVQQRWFSNLVSAHRLEHERRSNLTPDEYVFWTSKARVWTGRQVEAWDALHDPECKEVVLFGAVRTGKTDVALAWFVEHIMRHPDNDHGLICQSLPNYERLVDDLRFFAHLARLDVSKTNTGLRIGDTTITRLIANTETAYERIKGATWAGLFVDEGVECDAAALLEGFARCSVRGAKIVYCSNPGEPENDFSTEIRVPLARGSRPGKVVTFSATEERNDLVPTVDPTYRESLTLRYKPGTAMYRRYILGEDASMAGAVYPMVDQACQPRRPKGDPDRWYITVDPGFSTSASIALLVGVWPETLPGGMRERFVVCDEWRHLGVEQGSLTFPDQIASMLDHMVPLTKGVRTILTIDEADTQFRQQAVYGLAQRTDVSHIDIWRCPKGKIEDGIEAVQSALGWWLWIAHPRSKPEHRLGRLVRELRRYRYDPDKIEKGKEDAALGHFDACDALRYLVHGIVTRSIRPIGASS